LALNGFVGTMMLQSELGSAGAAAIGGVSAAGATVLKRKTAAAVATAIAGTTTDSRLAMGERFPSGLCNPRWVSWRN
jgi:hypothetical protein